MNQDRLLHPTVLALVAAVHLAVLSAAWQASPPSLEISTDSLSFVDLSGLSMAGATATAAAAPTPQRSQEKPQPKPKPVEKTKPAIKPVVKANTQGDIAPAPKPIPKPQAKEAQSMTPKPEPTQQTAGTQQTQKNHAGRGAQSKGSGTGSGSSSQDGGNAGGSLVPPTHLGSHLGNPKPPYPALSRENGEQGSVHLRVQVSADGRAQNVQLIKSSGYGRLDRSALNAVAKYRFVPATRGGTPIAYSYTFAINFSLRD